MQTLELSKLGMAALTDMEIMEVDGGGILDIIETVCGVIGCVALVISTPVTGPIGLWAAAQVAAAAIGTGVSIAGLIPHQ